MAIMGALLGIPAFGAVIAAGPAGSVALFALGTGAIGFAAGLFGHGTLTATMQEAPEGQTGLALGAWGAVQASAAGLAIALGGVLRDLLALAAPTNLYRGALPYDGVYMLEIALLTLTLGLMAPLVRRVAALA